MRSSRQRRTNKSDSRVGGNLLCEIAHYVLFFVLRGAHVSRVLVLASRRNNLSLKRESPLLAWQEKSPQSRDAIASTRDARAPQSNSPCCLSSCRLFAAPRTRLDPPPPSYGVTSRHRSMAINCRRPNLLSCRQRVSTSRSINRPPA